MIGLDRNEAILKAYTAQGHRVGRNTFPVRCDDQMVHWHLLPAGAGLGFAQALSARGHPGLTPVPLAGMVVPPLPVWLVLHEDARRDAHVRRVADCLSEALGELLTRDNGGE